MCAPAAFSASRTCCDSAFTCRAEPAVATISVSYRLVSLRTSSTVMSRALMSSRAVTAVCWILLRRIRERPIHLVAFNICQNRGGKQTAHIADPGGAARERGADRAGGDRLRRDRHAQDRAGERARESRRVGGEPPFPMHLQRRRKRVGRKCDA